MSCCVRAKDRLEPEIFLNCRNNVGNRARQGGSTTNVLPHNRFSELLGELYDIDDSDLAGPNIDGRIRKVSGLSGENAQTGKTIILIVMFERGSTAQCCWANQGTK